MLGFCTLEVKPFGPLHVYVAPEMVAAVRFREEPGHNGVLEAIIGAAGVGFTTTLVAAVADVHPLTTKYAL